MTNALDREALQKASQLAGAVMRNTEPHKEIYGLAASWVENYTLVAYPNVTMAIAGSFIPIDPAWEVALRCAHSCYEKYVQQGKVATEEERKEALSDSLQHGIGIYLLKKSRKDNDSSVA